MEKESHSSPPQFEESSSKVANGCVVLPKQSYNNRHCIREQIESCFPRCVVELLSYFFDTGSIISLRLS
ncbi:hypothetical protein L2E82_26832 [Cichorium intybus]|uniref:Uncharacterized protein n=1 Tax=Cichorium intybus TaxID=13427 RepID=A0ACB9CRE0_CICIN|nr:hypothetical protein L2E82_26832 [Cichorium intybus]